ncbi:DNA polymerase III subunit delta [Atopobiaceae bacterium 24-176]
MAQSLLPAYAAVGDNKVKREETVAHLKRHLDPAFGEFNLDECRDSAKLTRDAVLQSLDQLPFGEGQRFVIIHGADHLPKDVSEALVSYLKDPNPHTVLLLTAERLARNTRLYKAVAALDPKPSKGGPVTVIGCSLPKPWELPDLFVRFCASCGVTANQAAAAEVVDRVTPPKGDPTPILRQIAFQLSSRYGSGAQVGLREVKESVARIVEPKPWTFADAVAARDLPRALELYGLFRGDPEVLLHMFTVDRLRELACCRSLMAKGQGTPEAMAKAQGFPAQQKWRYKNHPRWARSFTDRELSTALRSAADCERALKGSGSSRTAFIQWITSVCS